MDDKTKNPNVEISGDTGETPRKTFKRVMNKHDKSKNFDHHRYLHNSARWWEKLWKKVRNKDGMV